jgi:hypothetical protein
MSRSNVVAISERFVPSKKSTAQASIVDKSASDACFSDWKRFCFVLREIACGERGRPLSGLEAQKRAQAVLSECGYTRPGRIEMTEPVVAAAAAPETRHTRAAADPEQSPIGTMLKNVAKVPSGPVRRRGAAPPSQHRVGAVASSGPG